MGTLVNGDPEAVFRNIATDNGITLQPGQTRFTLSDGTHVGMHKSHGTVKSDGRTTLDINQNGQIYKIRFGL